MVIITAMTAEKTKGRKRHIVTDTMGNLFCVHVHAANIHDTKGGVYTTGIRLFRQPVPTAVIEGRSKTPLKNSTI